jgi:hypothetical protein
VVGREALVVIDGEAGRVLDEIEAAAQVTQILAPRLVLVSADAGVLARIAEIPGVGAVYTDVIESPPPDLTPAERVFMSAWELRAGARSRIGDGLPWDATGFDPPDRPTAAGPGG